MNIDKTARELFEAAFKGGYDDDSAWTAVQDLQMRGTPEIFELAKEYSQSRLPMERARALDVLAQLGTGTPESKRPFVEESTSIALQHLSDDPLVVRSAAWALSHLDGDRAAAALNGLRNHPDPSVRQAVACGVAKYPNSNSIQTLIGLMEDPDDTVRDWATFTLGAQRDEDSSEIRDALSRHLTDNFEDARNEAVWGLARRRDPTGLKLLIERLNTDHWSGDEMTAAEILNLDSETPVENLRAGLQLLQDIDRPRSQ